MNKSEDIQKINEYIASGYEVNQSQIDTLNSLGWTIDWNKIGWQENEQGVILKPTFTKNINKDLEVYIYEELVGDGWGVAARQLYDPEDFKDSGVEPPGVRTEPQDDDQYLVLDDTPEVILVEGVSLEMVENLVNILKQ